jgi:hypothetical protein
VPDSCPIGEEVGRHRPFGFAVHLGFA